MVEFEKEICQYLNLPSIPIKEWDGKTGFKHGVAVLRHIDKTQSYAACSFEPEKDKEPRVIKTFSPTPFFIGFSTIYIVPNYMDIDVESMDLDDESKEAAKRIADEVQTLMQSSDDVIVKEIEALPEWIFPEIHNKEEAHAWLASYNKRNRIKGVIPKSEETIKLRLLNIYSQRNQQ